MFALVLQRMVTTIHTDEACAGLLQNAWYLDDGFMAFFISVESPNHISGSRSLIGVPG